MRHIIKPLQQLQSIYQKIHKPLIKNKDIKYIRVEFIKLLKTPIFQQGIILLHQIHIKHQKIIKIIFLLIFYMNLMFIRKIYSAKLKAYLLNIHMKSILHIIIILIMKFI